MRAILTYHSIDTTGSVISTAPDIFASHERWFASGRVRVLSLGDLLAEPGDDGPDAVAITFDDGFASCDEPATRLADHGLPTTLFIVSDHVGASNRWGNLAQRGIPTLPLLGWPALERLAAKGVAIGAHTCTHPRLPTLSTAMVEDEMDRCINTLADRLGVRTAFLAYPFGAVDDRVASLAGRRFMGALTTRFAPLSRPHSPMMIPRLDMYYFRHFGALERWGSPAFKRRLWLLHTARRVREALA